MLEISYGCVNRLLVKLEGPRDLEPRIDKMIKEDILSPRRTAW
jgi:hypothetical protein